MADTLEERQRRARRLVQSPLDGLQIPQAGPGGVVSEFNPMEWAGNAPAMPPAQDHLAEPAVEARPFGWNAPPNSPLGQMYAGQAQPQTHFTPLPTMGLAGTQPLGAIPADPGGPEIRQGPGSSTPLQDADIQRIMQHFQGVVGQPPAMESGPAVHFAGSAPTVMGPLGGGFFPGGQGYAIPWTNPNAERASMYNSRMANATGMLGEIMRNQLGQGALTIQGAQTFGHNGLPGSIQNNATQAYAGLLAAQNSPRAEDTARDAIGMQIYNSLQGSHDERIRQMQRNNQPIPRALGGGGNQPSSMSPIPPWLGGHGTPPAGAPSAGGSSPVAGGPVTPPGSTLPPSGVPPLARDTDPNNPANRSGGGRSIDNVDRAFQTARQVIQGAAPAQPGQPAARPTDPAAYAHAITTALSQMSEADLRANWPHIQDTLLQDFGGPAALDAWINQVQGSPTATWGSQGQQQAAQVQRLMRMANMPLQPVGPSSMGLSALQRLPAALSYPLSVMDQYLSGGTPQAIRR